MTPSTSSDNRPLLYDLFCGGGGAAWGYASAGFRVVGVDNVPQKNFPFEFILMDAFEFMRRYGAGEYPEASCFHASPPCQKYTSFAKSGLNPPREYADLVTATRAALRAAGRPYVIENVMTAPLEEAVVVCGSSFGLMVRRHRKFESNLLLSGTVCRHHEQGPPIGVYGNGGPKNPGGRGRRYTDRAEASRAMGGLDWMTLAEMIQAVPPAFTREIGTQLLWHLEGEAAS